MNRRAKGIGLLSGGLDSILAVKILQDQGLELLGLTFVTPFFGEEAGLAAGKSAGISMRAVDIGEKHLRMLRNPRYGYGSQMNPCIDCHALMLREAGAIMEVEGADFLFTGEVVGQRPMSQRRDAMRSVEKLSGCEGRVLRPLSAKILPPTIPELEGLVDRERLGAIQGRGRKAQVALAEHYGITDYPQPGGGCMLTTESYAIRLRELLQRIPRASVHEVELLKWGRNFLLPGGSWCVVGRRREDNLGIEALADEGDVLLRASDHKGPTALLMGASFSPEDLPAAAEIVVAYSDAPAGEPARVEWRGGGSGEGVLEALRTDKERFAQYMMV